MTDAKILSRQLTGLFRHSGRKYVKAHQHSLVAAGYLPFLVIFTTVMAVKHHWMESKFTHFRHTSCCI
jgi:hypothetical protein